MPPENFRDYYADLGLKPDASHTSIKSAFHALAKQHHPDKTGESDTTAFRRAREAYEKLSNASYRAEYDENYWNTKLSSEGRTEGRTDGASDEGLGYTRTAQYEQEEERSHSPPPMKPTRKPREPSWQYFNGKAYTGWQRKDNEHRMRHPERNEMRQTYETTTAGNTAHGLTVKMSSHPAAKQLCRYRTQHWRVQAAGVDYCVFCMAPTKEGSRCSGCEALACPKCMKELVELERKEFGGLRSRAQYCASGG